MLRDEKERWHGGVAIILFHQIAQSKNAFHVNRVFVVI